MTGAAYMQSELADRGTEIIPLFKGYTPSEWELSLRSAEKLDVSRIAIYVSRYFSGNNGNNRKKLFRDLRKYGDCDMPPTLLIGLLSPQYLQRVPDYVVGASGQNQWRSRYDPETQSPTQSVTAYTGLAEEVATALDVPASAATVQSDDPVRPDDPIQTDNPVGAD